MFNSKLFCFRLFVFGLFVSGLLFVEMFIFGWRKDVLMIIWVECVLFIVFVDKIFLRFYGGKFVWNWYFVVIVD